MTLRKPAIASLLILTASQPLLAESFNEQQTEDIQKIVREYLVENPEILVEVSQALETKQKLVQAHSDKMIITANSDALFKNSTDPVAGNPNGDITLVEFFDYNCGYCKRAKPVIDALVKNNPDLRVVYKELPVLSEGSSEGARAALAVNELWPDKYVAFHNALMEQRGIDKEKAKNTAEELGLNWDKLEQAMQSDDIKQAVADVNQLAYQMGITGTPAFVLGNQVVRGMNPAALQQALEAARKDNQPGKSKKTI